MASLRMAPTADIVKVSILIWTSLVVLHILFHALIYIIISASTLIASIVLMMVQPVVFSLFCIAPVL